MSQFNMAVMADPFRGGIALEEGLPDGILLNRFINDRDASAFETLLRRHGPRVLQICRRSLREMQDAEDACQATFLVLIDRAAAIRESENVGGWLCGVARRIAARAKMQADLRRSRESAVDFKVVAEGDETDSIDLQASLKAEVNRLPEKYRRPIELCYWEGLSSEQAARRLECPTGTLKWRLSRAREILRSRLGRICLAFLMLLMGRDGKVRGASLVFRVTGRVGDMGHGPRADQNNGLSGEFVQDTLAMAAFVRDVSISAGTPQKTVGVAKSGILGKLAIGPPALILAIVIGLLLFGIPSVRRLIAAPSAVANVPGTKSACH